MPPPHHRPDRRGADAGRRPRWACYAACLPGLEPFVVAELEALGHRCGPVSPGGVPFTASTRQLYAANLHLACATRVLVRLGSFGARSFRDLEVQTAALAWADHLPAGVPVDLRVTAKASKLHHTGAIAERVGDVITDVLVARDGWVPPPAADGDPSQLVVVRVARDRVTISLDSSGEPLHRRSWRLATAKAPLRPTIAAALLTASGWDGTTPLVDPFCGSGTIAIEAARRARGIPAGWGRQFAFADWPGFEPGTWASVHAAALAGGRAGPHPPIVAADRDAGAVAATVGNAERAEVADGVEVREAAVSALLEPGALPHLSAVDGSATGGPGAVVTNPPYGQRIVGGDLRNLFDRTGDVLRAVAGGWTVAVLAADPVAVGHLRLPLEEVARTTNGGIAVRILRGTVPTW